MALPLLVLVLVVSTNVMLQGKERSVRRADAAAAQITDASNAILLDSLNAETSIRGFALTHDTTFLGPYDAALENQFRDDNLLRSDVRAAGSHAAIESLLVLSEAKFASLNRIHGMVLAGVTGRPLAVELQIGKSTMDLLRTQVTSVDDYEARVSSTKLRRIATIESEIATAELAGLLLGVVGGVVSMILFAQSITRRLGRAVRNARRLGAGEALVFEPATGDEFDAIDDALRLAEVQLTSSSRDARQSLVAATSALEKSRVAELQSQQAQGERTVAEGARAAAVEDRQLVEAQLHQSQRLESLGHLAGGVAHDFNNLLAVILNYASFVGEELTSLVSSTSDERWSGALQDVGQIQLAAERASMLTHQLLSFARREVVQPRELNLNETITKMEQILRRTIGEQIELAIQLTGGGADVIADPGQLEQVILNLAINARDAMPGGGSLSITTSTRRISSDEEYITGLAAGSYVSLRVSDSGTGMSDEVRERAFEPFFTTKAPGDGTGLGLATVYGIVKQSGGRTAIYTDEGIGTSINVVLPSVKPPVPAATPAGGVTPFDALRGTETILVVDDEEALREVTGRMLTRNGYHVLSASSGAQAIDIAAHFEGVIDLLLTDVIMPVMQGPALAREVRKIRPDVGLVYMSGHALPVLESEAMLGTTFRLVEKPFDQLTLLTNLRHVLDLV